MTDLSDVTGAILTTTGMVIGIKTMDRVSRVGTKRRTKSGRTKATAYGITYTTSTGKRRLHTKRMFKSRSAATRSSIYKKLKKQHKNPRPKKIVITVRK